MFPKIVASWVEPYAFTKMRQRQTAGKWLPFIVSIAVFVFWMSLWLKAYLQEDKRMHTG